ncbi:MAG TPA: hypothetical protein PKG60_07020 [Spirochaetota bacterium]|nr:hypothetical protein [Spirochaetota bacterium]HPS85301.1 hypothetical protein [Spirochaetota bacterium]
MKKLIFSLLMMLMVFSAPGFFTETAHAGNGAVIFMSSDFAKLLVDAWNNSSLPVKLGSKETGGSDWINTPNKYTGEKRNRQVIVMSRRDCPSMPKVQLTIENKQGRAVCTYGGLMIDNYDKAEWAFSPTTTQWYKFASGDWGYMQMPGIMPGFRGPMFVARANIDNFGEFWKVAGRVAKKINADYTSSCPIDSGDIEDIKKYLGKIW